MKINLVIMLFVALLVGCAKSSDDITLTPQGVEVVIGASGVAATRTALDGDGETVKWCVGDQVAVWADGDSNSSSNIVGEMFQLNYYGSNYSTAEFSSSLTEAMDDDQLYTYRAFYPYPESGNISSKSVSYTIPSTQKGEYDGSLDFRVAAAVKGSALNGTIIDNAQLEFKSITHALKITIPEGYNKLGEPIKKLTLTFPTEVVGDVSYDMESMTQSVSGEGKVVTLDLSDNPIEEGDYIWAFINPVSGVSGDLVISGIGCDDEGKDVYAKSYTISLADRSFSAGYYTTVGVEIGEEMPSTVLQINITSSNLGEDLDTIKFTAPEGVVFSQSGSNVATIANDGTGIYEVSYITEFYDDYFGSGDVVDVWYESEHTSFASTSIAKSKLTSGGTYIESRVVPYLLEEDFSTISSFSYHDYPGVGEWDSDAAEGKSGQDLSDSDYGSLATSGWTANRCGAYNQKAIRLMGRYEYGAYVTSHLESRLDSPAFSKLKEGKTPTVLVKFKYKSARYSKYYGVTGQYSWWPYANKYGYVTGGNGVGQYNVGSTTTQGGISGEDDISSTYYSSYQTLPNTAGGDLSDPGDCGASEHNTSMSASLSTGINTSGSFTISNATNLTRASWRVTNSMSTTSTGGANGNFWMYIDDITIEID